MFSIKANTMYSLDEKGQHSLEISYTDSDGVNVGAYSEGDKFEDVIFDVIDQLDEGIAEFNDDKADVAEIDDNEEYIRQLQQQIAELQARNAELKERHAKKFSDKKDAMNELVQSLKSMTEDLSQDCADSASDLYKIFQKGSDDIVAGKNKVSDFPFAPKWWA